MQNDTAFNLTDLADWLANPLVYACGIGLAVGFVVYATWDWWQGDGQPKPPPGWNGRDGFGGRGGAS